MLSRVCRLKIVWNSSGIFLFPRFYPSIKTLLDFFSVGAQYYTCIFLTIWFLCFLTETKGTCSALGGNSQECLILSPKEKYMWKNSLNCWWFSKHENLLLLPPPPRPIQTSYSPVFQLIILTISNSWTVNLTKQYLHMPRNLIGICQVLRRIPISHVKFYDIRYSLEKSTGLPFIRIPAICRGRRRNTQK